LLLVVLSPAFAFAQPSTGDRYYVLVFGGQGEILRPRTAHTWATFVRSSPEPNGQAVETHTISWLPAKLRIRSFALRAEPGVNLTLDETFQFMNIHRHSRVSVWGPYEIPAERFEQALRQKELLESGAIQYHAFGLFGRRSDVMHCIDGLTRIDAAWERAASPSRWFGQAGTGQAVRAAVRSGFIPRPAIPHEEIRSLVVPSEIPLIPRRLRPIRER
jgi:hypothetical protein